MLTVAVAPSSYDTVRYVMYVLPVLWMTSCFHSRLCSTSCVFLSGESMTVETTAWIPTKFCLTIKVSKYIVCCAPGESLLSVIALRLILLLYRLAFSFFYVSQLPYLYIVLSSFTFSQNYNRILCRVGHNHFKKYLHYWS